MASENEAPKWAPSVRVWTNICMTHRRPWSPFYARWKKASLKAWAAGYARLPYFRRRPRDKEDAVTRLLNIRLNSQNGRLNKKWKAARPAEAKNG